MQMTRNLLLKTDSYKLAHWAMYPENTDGVYSYMESRAGAAYPYTVFFGLQYILKAHLAGNVFSRADVERGHALAAAHFGDGAVFNRDGWIALHERHGGRLPLRIKAVAEGSVVPTGNVLMTVENTDPDFPWITNYVESLLTHVWYPSTVATRSHHALAMIADHVRRTGGDPEVAKLMLHDFGYRGAAGDEAAALGGAGHLVNGLGTDTLAAMELLMSFYGAELDGLALSVPATEHSVMTALGRVGEQQIVGKLLDGFPGGILSVVGDSYDIYGFVESLGTRFRERVLARDGVLVVRPDSPTPAHPTPDAQVLALVEQLERLFGATTNARGFKVLDPHVRVLWGDGLDEAMIEAILDRLSRGGYAAENVATFGMGGGLLQKLDRDTQHFAFKSSAQSRGGAWHDISKVPLDQTKRSKAGRLKLVVENGELTTVSESHPGEDQLVTVFENGELRGEATFADIRERAAGARAVAAALRSLRPA